jgi:tRNA threonylcarbamoyladenosine biosynthesis protein TsaB
VTPLILAIDTTREWGSLALARGETILKEEEVESLDGFAHIIYERFARLLEGHGLRPQDIDCFASAGGPGSFTGVRVGLACVKGLAEACGKPAVAVSNLEALASFGSAPLRAAVMDARRAEVYGGVFDAEGRSVTPEVVGRLDSWLKSLPQGDIEFVYAGFEDFGALLAGTSFACTPILRGPRAMARAIARIALRRFACGEAKDPAVLDANYVRRSDAELFWKE